MEPDPGADATVSAARDVDKVVAAVDRSLRTIVWAIVVATLLIAGFTYYLLRISDPYWRCKRLAEEEKGFPRGRSEAELRTLDDLECDRWPGI
jgi:hypothetical protein